MLKKFKYVIISSLLIACGVTLESLSKDNKAIGFYESASDVLSNNKKLNKSVLSENSSEIDVSKMFIQNGTSEDGKQCLRFAVALKGDISTLTFQRGHVEGKNDVDSYSVNTVYRGISADNKVYFYNPSAPENVDGLTTDENYAGEYYWACYTIRFLDESFYTSNIPLTLTINERKVDRKASLAESLFGAHTHNYDKFSFNELQHYKTCSLCGTIDDTSYHSHTYDHYNPVFNKTYEVGEVFNQEDLSLYQSCECSKQTEKINFEYISTPSNIAFGDSVLVKTDTGNKNITIPVNFSKKMTKDDTSLKYGGGYAGIVGQDTDFRFKEAYEIVDGKFKMIGTEGDYSYGNVFINIDANASKNPYMQFPLEVKEDSQVRFIMSSSNNYTKRNGVYGSYEQELKKTMDILVDETIIDYNDVTLKAIPETALADLEKTTDGYKKYVYFTFYEYDLVTMSLPKGSHTIRFNFKNGYENTEASSLDSTQPCVGCINYFRFETIAETKEHIHDYNVKKHDEQYHWNECACGVIDETSKELHNVGVHFLKDEYRSGSNFDGTSEIELNRECSCGFVMENKPFVLKQSPTSGLKLGDTIIIEVDGKDYQFEIPVYELNIKQVPVKTDYLTGEKFDITGLILNKKFSSKIVDYEVFDINQVTYEEKELTKNDTYVTVTYDEMNINIPVNVRQSALKVELEDNNSVTYTTGVQPNGQNKMPGSKLGITRLDDGTFKVGSKVYNTYDEAYQAAYNAGSNATKIQVAQASEGDFLAFLDGTGATFTVNLRNVEAEQMELSIRGASNWAFDMRNWTPYQIGEIFLNDFMTIKVNGTEIDIANDVKLPGCGDGTHGDHAYWTNWVTLDLGLITLDPTLEVNTIEFAVSIEKGLNEEGKYKYCYNNGTSYAFGQYDYILLEERSI